jgi:hypothetical protein
MMRRRELLLPFGLCLVMWAAPALAGSGASSSPDEASQPAASPASAPDLATDEQGTGSYSAAASAQSTTHLYGYLSTRYEKVFSEPGYDSDGEPVREDPPGEFSFPYFHIMMQHRANDHFKAYFNINGGGAETLDVRNMWVEYSAVDQFNARMGKIYRKFGLYNEILDAVPTYIGIEPPELFDNDHLIVSRTTNLMAYGRHDTGSGTFNYSVTTENGEGGSFPLGFDARFGFHNDEITLGTSGFTSGGDMTSDVALGEGPPHNGVLPWMARDSFEVFGGFFELQSRHLILQAEYWRSSHDGERDPSTVVELVNSTVLNDRQLARFLTDPDGPVTEENVNIPASYVVETGYLRAGYSFETDNGEFVPYAQWDWYSNPETIAEKKYGGDNEAGIADDGRFHKGTVGLVYRPTPEIAIKLDGSTHVLKFDGQTISFPEIRFDVSYVWGL